jgi:hypothetical protein
MSQIGRYAKGCLVARLREFAGWRETASARPLQPDDVLFVHENFVVTDSIFLDEKIIFQDVSPEWSNFCREVLNVNVPEDVRAMYESDSATPVSG